MLSIATRHGLAALLLLTSGSVAAMEAMSEDELGAVTGAGVGFLSITFSMIRVRPRHRSAA